MGKRERLKRDLLRGQFPVEADIEDVQALYEEAGWFLDRITGSHEQFTKLGERTEPIAVHGKKVGRAALRKLARALTE